MGKKDKRASKKKPIAEAPANSSNKLLIENLKTVNASLIEETAECRREIERLRIQLESLVVADDDDIFHGIKDDVFALVVSSGLRAFASRVTSEMAATSEDEKNLKNKVEVMAREANGKDIELIALVKEKAEKDDDLEELRNKIRSMEQGNEDGRWRKNLICSVFASVSLVTAAGAAFVFWKMFKK